MKTIIYTISNKFFDANFQLRIMSNLDKWKCNYSVKTNVCKDYDGVIEIYVEGVNTIFTIGKHIGKIEQDHLINLANKSLCSND